VGFCGGMCGSAVLAAGFFLFFFIFLFFFVVVKTAFFIFISRKNGFFIDVLFCTPPLSISANFYYCLLNTARNLF
jgi:hypothetical protein